MKTFFDILITLGIFITAIPASILLYSRIKRTSSWEAHHPQTSITIASILLCGTAILVWGSFIEPHSMVINRYEIDLPYIHKPLTIALIADMQIGTYKGKVWTQKIVDKTLALKPDLILFGGDNVDNMYYNEYEAYELSPLKQLTEKIPTYAVHGNHEYGIGGKKSVIDPSFQVADMSTHTKEILESLGVRYLVNELEEIQVHDNTIYLFGGDDYWAQKLNFSALHDEINATTLALIHNPSFIAKSYPSNVDLYLSGHTHGGQIRLPIIGPVGRVDDFLPTVYYRGLHTLETGSQLLVTSGIGETGTRARLFNPPEIAFITIK